jgi:hypothetical protein
MGDKFEIREKTTAPITMQLLEDGVAIDLSTAEHVEMKLTDARGMTFTYASSSTSTFVSLVGTSTGFVQFTPPSDDTFVYLRQPYHLFWWIYEDSIKKYSVPNKGYAEINVVKE